ncbi:TetR/AcrR family transcriptional regulator [Bradyrhizobium sp. Pear76]|uniref:TetR/AcrR family transcriptional regulator n=1 Tax=Bradyrhizobium oropedii TaxID=1571201 RepID=UPI001E626BA8|nr:TetR/AcrR family transcriptional regulator [Bradyrhizobium oropedii]MCC8967462.1 TetR/AcrR family transcriptional regulator [Bradyrhizobium oropedii]
MARAVRRAQEPRDDALASRRTQVERRDEAERRILEAAALIVAENGLDAITLAEAGERAGYSRGLPSHYFKTKADLLSALATYVIESFISTRRAAAPELTGYDGLIASSKYYFMLPARNPVMARAFHAVLAAALTVPPITATVAGLNRETRGEIAAGLNAGIAAGRLRADIDLETESALILATLRGSIAQWLVDPEGVDLETMSVLFIAAVEGRLAK